MSQQKLGDYYLRQKKSVGEADKKKNVALSSSISTPASVSNKAQGRPVSNCTALLEHFVGTVHSASLPR
jgi:hypothetical protein